MDTIMSTITEIPMTHIVVTLTISTIALISGRLKLALLLNYCFIIYSGHFWEFSLLKDAGSASLNTQAFLFTGFWIVIVFFAAVSLIFHNE